MELSRRAGSAVMRVIGVRRALLKAGRTIVAGARRYVRPLVARARPTSASLGTLRPAAVTDPARRLSIGVRGSTLLGAMGIRRCTDVTQTAGFLGASPTWFYPAVKLT